MGAAVDGQAGFKIIAEAIPQLFTLQSSLFTIKSRLPGVGARKAAWECPNTPRIAEFTEFVKSD
jgi:hypothetical protein